MLDQNSVLSIAVGAALSIPLGYFVNLTTPALAAWLERRRADVERRRFFPPALARVLGSPLFMTVVVGGLVGYAVNQIPPISQLFSRNDTGDTKPRLNAPSKMEEKNASQPTSPSGGDPRKFEGSTAESVKSDKDDDPYRKLIPPGEPLKSGGTFQSDSLSDSSSKKLNSVITTEGAKGAGGGVYLETPDTGPNSRASRAYPKDKNPEMEVDPFFQKNEPITRGRSNRSLR